MRTVFELCRLGCRDASRRRPGWRGDGPPGLGREGRIRGHGVPRCSIRAQLALGRARHCRQLRRQSGDRYSRSGGVHGGRPSPSARALGGADTAVGVRGDVRTPARAAGRPEGRGRHRKTTKSSTGPQESARCRGLAAVFCRVRGGGGKNIAGSSPGSDGVHDRRHPGKPRIRGGSLGSIRCGLQEASSCDRAKGLGKDKFISVYDLFHG